MNVLYMIVSTLLCALCAGLSAYFDRKSGFVVEAKDDARYKAYSWIEFILALAFGIWAFCFLIMAMTGVLEGG